MKMQLRTFSWFIILYLCIGCSQAGIGPTTWIDIPPEAITLPLAPFSIMAHASGDNGVESINFHINGELQISLPPTFKGEERIGWAEWEFSPSSPGIYRIEVSAVDASGTAGAIDTAIVAIMEEDMGGEFATPIEIPGPDTEGEQATPIEIPGPETGSEEDEDPIAVANRNANCREGPGTEYEIEGALLLEEQADIVGRLGDSSWFLIALPESAINCWISAITVDTQGNMDAVSIASAPPLPAPPAEEESPPADIEPPGIFGSAPSKTTMCASSTVNSNVVAWDESGIKKIYANWNIKNTNGDVLESGYVEYAPIPSMDDAYTAELGNFTYTGTLTINGKVEDYAGNTASFSNTVTIDCS